MSTAYFVVAGLTILMNAAIVAADLAKAEFVVKNSGELGLPMSWLPSLAALKAAGAAGILLGLLGIPLIDTAAAAGLVAFFCCAVVVHLRARVYYNLAFPGAYLTMAAATLTLSIAR